MAEPSTSDIDRLVYEKFPELRAYVALLPLANLHKGKNASKELVEKAAQLAAARAAFLAMPRDKLLALIAANREREQAAKCKRDEEKQAANDTQRFYNQPSAAADFGYWCKLSHWTIDEAAALLLGRDPHAVNPETIARELSQNTGFLKIGKPPERRPFHQSYEQLRTLIARSDGLDVDCLQPGKLVMWAIRSKSVRVPDELIQLLGMSDVNHSAAIGPASKPQAGTPLVWDTDQLEKLKQYRAAHGTKAAAQHFGISTTRIRQLLPATPTQTAASASTPFKSLVHRLK